EARIAAKHEPAHLRMQAIGADHEVEPTQSAPLEVHVERIRVVAQPGDAIIEARDDVGGQRLVETDGQLAARQARKASLQQAFEAREGYACDARAIPVDLS